MSRTLVTDSVTQLLHQHHLLSAPQLVAHLHKQGRIVNKTSVYRALEKLETEGSICKHNLLDNELVYELRDHHHDHLICTHCGTITTAECQIELPSMVNDFKVNHHHLTVYGLCAECQKLNA